MDINKMVKKLREHPDSGRIGMIASHLGIVRRTSRSGQRVTEIQVSHDHHKINDIIQDIKRLPGIVEILVETQEGRLKVGDDILALAVAGDIRENVFPALITAVNRIKTEASKKKEYA